MGTKPLCPGCGKPLDSNAPNGLCPECLMKGAFPTGSDAGGKPPRFVPPKIEELAAKFPQLEILEFIGQGGMGAVYKARQKQLDRIVALKILPPQTAAAPGFAERFTREARALAKLNHPLIVSLYEFGQADGLFYFFMEFVDGINLRQLLHNSRIAPKEALAIVPQICEALQFAHERGIVHRDIKPENILLSREGQVKIADFGVAKIVGQGPEAAADNLSSRSGDLTQAGSTLGTPQYMAPEQLKNSAEVDSRADIYSLGIVFYQMLTGELPSGKIEPPSKKVQIDVRLDEVVLRALEKEPQLRYQQANDVKTRLETIARTPESNAAQRVEAHSAKPEDIQKPLASSSPAPSGRTSGRIVMLALAIVIVLLLGNLFGLWSPRPSSIKSDYIGSTWFPEGDSIQITSVKRTENRIKVLGHYRLVSRDRAELALHITSKFVGNHSTPPEQEIKISRGEGDFELVHSDPVPGCPHLSMYGADGQAFATLYFGTEAEAIEEKKSVSHTPHAADGSSPSAPNKTADSNGPKVVSVSPADGATNVDVRQEIRIRFDQPMNPDDLWLMWMSGGFVPNGQPHYDSALNEFVIPVWLSRGTNELVVNTRPDNIGGFRSSNSALAREYRWHFMTKPFPSKLDVEEPAVVGISPAPGEPLPVLTQFEITFNQPMLPPTQSPPYLRTVGWEGMGPPAIVPAFDYNPELHRFTVPVLLPPDNETKLTLEGFKAANGAAAEPVVISCHIGTNNYSREQSDLIAAAAKDPRLEQLLSSMKTARARFASGTETVRWLSLFGGKNSFNQQIMSQSAVFKWRGTNQVVADISDVMHVKTFILGTDGTSCWLYSDVENSGRRLNSAPLAAVPRVYVSVADPFALAGRTVKSAIAKDRLIYEGQAQLGGRSCHRVQSWRVHQSQNEPSGVSAFRLEWWIDAETFLPVQVVECAQFGSETFSFHYDKLNQPLPAAAFQPPIESGVNVKSDDWFERDPGPDDKRFLTIKDGCDGEMSGRLGVKGPGGTTSSGLN